MSVGTFRKTSSLIGLLFNMQLIRAGFENIAQSKLGNPLSCPPPPSKEGKATAEWTSAVGVLEVDCYTVLIFIFHSVVSKNFDSPLWRKTSKIFSPNGSSLRICERGEWVA